MGLALVLFVVLLVVWATGQTATRYRYVAGFQGLPPFVAALFAIRRLTHHEHHAGTSGLSRRYAAGLGIFILGLLTWSAAEFGLLYYGFVAPSLPNFPSWLEFGPISSLMCWTAVVFITFEGFVETSGQRFDFLKAVNDDSRMLAIFFATNIALLTAFHGADVQNLLRLDGGPQAVGFVLDVFYTTTDLFLLWMTVRLLHGEPGQAMVQGRSALVVMAVGLGLLYVADLVFCLNFAVGERQGELLFSRYFGIIPDFFYIAAIVCLSVAAQLYPLAPPVFASDTQ